MAIKPVSKVCLSGVSLTLVDEAPGRGRLDEEHAVGLVGGCEAEDDEEEKKEEENEEEKEEEIFLAHHYGRASGVLVTGGVSS